MFQGPGYGSGRKRAEELSRPSMFVPLAGYDAVEGRPTNTVTSGHYTPVPVNIGMTPPAPTQQTPFAIISRL